jgi:uncharacterized protein
MPTGLKTSRYTRVVPADDGWMLLYNALTNSFARVPPPLHDAVREILRDPDGSAGDAGQAATLKAELRKGGFLVDAGLDELGLQRLTNRASRFATTHLGLTIAPTMACNFRCSYCFEERRSETMTPEVEDAVVAFVERRAREIQALSLSWFGGEPTLRLDIIERLVGRLGTLCKEKDIAFPPMTMITNGYLLTSAVATVLKGLNITSVQITLDGPPEVHDSRRRLANGGATFATILENAKGALGTLNVAVRINIDRSNVEALDGLFDVFAANGLSGKLPFYFGHVQPFGDACADIGSACLSTQEYSALILDLQRRAREKGLTTPVRYPSAHTYGYCTADRVSGFVVAPSGALFKCFSEIGADLRYSVGSVLSGDVETYQLSNLCRYLNWDPYQDPDCSACYCLPICAGGCPFLAHRRGDTCACVDFKFNLDEVLKLKYDEVKRAGPRKQRADGPDAQRGDGSPDRAVEEPERGISL